MDDFENSEKDRMPEDWAGRKDEAKKYYKISAEEGNKDNNFLSVENDKTDMFIIKKVKVDLVKYPYLNWKWRVNKFPPNADESIKKLCDVPASVNVVLVAKKWRPKTIKYTWSTTLEKDTHCKSPYAFWPSRCDIIVMQSGEENQGQWISEKRNVLEDFKKLYKKDKVKSKEIQAIVIMSDGDNTQSFSAADYDNIYFSVD